MQSNPTQNTSPRSVSSQSTKLMPAIPVNPPPVEARDANKPRLMFERTLERAAQSEAFSSERSSGFSQRSIEDRPERDTRGGSDQSSEQDEDQKDRPLGSDIAINARAPLLPMMAAAFAPLVTAAMPLLNPEQIATLQKMAAAIAEVGKTGVDAKMTIQFGQLNGVADGAVLGRDARGALTVHLIGAPPHMTPANAQQLRDDLMQRLLKRKLNVSTVDFLEPETLTENAVNRKDAKG
jgi:hypothetical protein